MTMTSSLRILDLCEFFSERGGGVRSYLEKFGKAAEKQGHCLTVVAPGERDEESTHSGMKLVRYRAPRMPYDGTYRVPWRLDVMRRIVCREQPHVVQISSPFAPALAARLLSPGPLRVYFHHSDPIGCYVRPVLRRLLSKDLANCIEHAAWSWHRSVSRACDATVVAGHWLETQLSEVGCERVITVPFGVVHSDLGPHCESPVLRRSLMGPLADDENAVLVLIAGRLAIDKRQALLIDALHVVHRARPVAMIVLGDGPARASLERRARGLGHVTFLPFTHDRGEFAAVLASVDLLVHAALCETFGFVLAEALASGTPVVGPAEGGAGALLHRDYAEAYAPDADAREVARAVQRLVSRPRAELSRAAVRAAAILPSSEEHFRHLFDLYRRLLREREARASVVKEQR